MSSTLFPYFKSIPGGDELLGSVADVGLVTEEISAAGRLTM